MNLMILNPVPNIPTDAMFSPILIFLQPSYQITEWYLPIKTIITKFDFSPGVIRTEMHQRDGLSDEKYAEVSIDSNRSMHPEIKFQ